MTTRYPVCLSLLFGGAGSDTLHGGSDDDLLIGGVSTYDENLTALLALQAEWSRTDVDYLTRIGHLNGTVGGGLNGTYLLNSQSVTDDGAQDTLFGHGGQDCSLLPAEAQIRTWSVICNPANR
jgi:hypothetical protein